MNIPLQRNVKNLEKVHSEFVSLSFETISSSGPNGAVIHYKPESNNSRPIKIEELYLCDSGGQYKTGTTDVTRTMHFGTPSQFQKDCFTRVLKGVISLEKLVIPEGTTGNRIDTLARMHLWENGLDYRHGTGHGVGSFLNVHEGPQGISFRDSPWSTPFQAGMTVTNEPGYYEDDSFGIRIENQMVVKEINTEHNFGGKKYFGFENLTIVPIQTKMVNIKLMTKKEIAWLNDHNKRCFDLVSPYLESKQKKWLEKETKPIGKHWIPKNKYFKFFVTGAAASVIVGLIYLAQKK